MRKRPVVTTCRPIAALTLIFLWGGLLVPTEPAAAGDAAPATQPTPTRRTDNADLDRVLRRVGEDVAGGQGRWRATVEDVTVMVITDARADRMRIIAPIADADQLSKQRLLKCMEANFDRALDARYAIAHGRLWSAYIHPLSPLTEAQFESGLRQVAALKQNYGDSYASSGLVFGGAAPANAEDKAQAPPEDDAVEEASKKPQETAPPAPY